MTAGENRAIVERSLVHFLTTGEPEFSSMHPDVEVHDHDIPDAGEYRGHEGFVRWVEDWGNAWESYRMRPESFIASGNRVVALVHMSATGGGSGLTLERNDALVYELRDGLIARIDYFNDQARALAAAGIDTS